MKEATKKGKVEPINQQQCKLYHQLADFAKELNRLPDAREAVNNKARSAPQELLPMVF
jgi:hypothetical protein